MRLFINILILLVLSLGYLYINDRNLFYSIYSEISTVVDSDSSVRKEDPNDEQLATLYENHLSGVQVLGAGRVIRILPDDNDGSRHQRFIIRLASRQTLLISHNIDIAPAITSLSNNDEITFYGQYEWNPEGGVVHWTHSDPGGRHVDGWLVHDGRTYK